MSSFVSGSNPTSSTICFIRRTIESPIRAWDWMMTKFRAVNKMRGVLIGGFSSRVTLDLTEAACIVDIVWWPLALASDIVYVSLPRASPTTREVRRSRGPAAAHPRLAVLGGDPEVRYHLRARGAELHEFDRREGFLLVPPDREGRPAGRDLLAVCRLDSVAFHRGPVEDRVRDGDLLAASLAEHDRERVQGVLVIEDDVRLERFELLVEDEQGDARAVAGHVFDSQVIHEDVDRAVSDEVADDVIDDLVLRGRGEAQAARLDERVDGLLEVLLLVLLRHLVPFVFERAVQGVLDHVEELLLLRVELRFPDLVDVLGAIVVVDDARVGERLSDRDDLDFLQGVAREIRDVREVGAARAGPLGLLLNRAPRHEDLFLFRHLGSP